MLGPGRKEGAGAGCGAGMSSEPLLSVRDLSVDFQGDAGVVRGEEGELRCLRRSDPGGRR